MSWLQKAGAALARVLSIRDPQHWGNQEGDAPAGVAVTERTALGHPAVWACVNLLAGTFASLSCEATKPAATGGTTIAADHYLHRLLHESPNADQTAYDFWEYVVFALELRGNFHARIERSGTRITALTPIYAEVTPRRVEDGSIRYRWTDEGRSYDEPQENVFHIRGFGGTPLAGLSTLAFARHAFGLAIATDRAASTTFANGLRPSGVLTFGSFLKPDQRKDLEEGLQRKFVGAMNAGRPMVLEGGSKWEQLTISPEDAQMLQSRGFSVEEICRFYGVPPFMIGHTSTSTSWGTGLSEQTLGFQKFSLRRRAKRIEQAIRKQLMTAQDRAAGLKVKFNFEDLLRGAPAERAAFYNAGLANGWFTINEVRGLENLPPVDGGDVPRMQMQNVPISLAGAAQLVTSTPAT